MNDLFYWEQQQIKVYCKYIVVVAGGGRAVVGGLTILFTRKRSGYRHLRPFSSRVSCFERILSGFWHASSANDGGIVLKIRQKSASFWNFSWNQFHVKIFLKMIPRKNLNKIWIFQLPEHCMWRAAIFDLTSKAVVSKQVASLVFFFLDHLEMLWLMKSYHLSKKAAVQSIEDCEIGIFHKHFRGHLAKY